MTNLLKQLENAVKRQHRGGKKKKAKKTAKRRTKRKAKIVVRTRTVHVHHRPKAKHRAAPRASAHAKRKTAKKRKGGKVSKAEFLRRMALGRARAKRARKH